MAALKRSWPLVGLRRLPLVLLAAAGTAGVAAACGGGSSGQTSARSSAPAPPPAETSSAGGTGTTVVVDESNFTIKLSTTTFSPGTYTFMVKDSGPGIHALEIDGPGVADRRSDNLAPGGSTAMTVTLQKGTYELYCPVDSHKGRGMDTRITVS
ncbi:MAG TPA: hypothetical protein VF054_12700 [Micromonosporaceae bacterium]